MPVYTSSLVSSRWVSVLPLAIGVPSIPPCVSASRNSRNSRSSPISWPENGNAISSTTTNRFSFGILRSCSQYAIAFPLRFMYVSGLASTTSRSLIAPSGAQTAASYSPVIADWAAEPLDSASTTVACGMCSRSQCRHCALACGWAATVRMSARATGARTPRTNCTGRTTSRVMTSGSAVGLAGRRAQDEAARQNVEAPALAAFSMKYRHRAGLMLGYAGYNERETRLGVRRLATALHKMMNEK